MIYPQTTTFSGLDLSNSTKYMSSTDFRVIQNVHLGQENSVNFKYDIENGLHFKRVFSQDGQDPFDLVEYERRSSIIREPDGTVVFEMKDIEIPKDWSQVATDIVAQKYFRKTGVPQYYKDGTSKLNSDGKPMFGPETSVKQIIHRLAGTWRYWAEKYGYFASPQDAEIFYDELVAMLLKQMAAPNSPQWFNTGLFWAYGINGPAQGHYFVDPDTGAMTRSTDSYTHPQPHACGRYNTKVFTERGILELGALVERCRTGLKVFDGESMVKILAVKNNGVRKLYRATLKNGNFIEFTDDHHVWTAGSRKKDGGKYEWLELNKILGKKVVQVAPTNGGISNKKPDESSLDRAALAGWIVGDGYYGKYGRNKKTTMFGAITVNDDEFNFVTGLFKRIFGRHTVRTRKNISPLYRTICFDSKEVDEFVLNYDLEKTALTVDVPKKIMAGTKEEKSVFLASLFQADGSVRIRKDGGRNSGDVVLTSISEDLIHSVQILLLELGMYSNVSWYRDSRPDRHLCFQLTISYDSERNKFADLIGFISKDKQFGLSKLNKQILGKTKESRSEETVESIEYIGEEEVYDIQTESGQFCANGVVVHNCFIQSIKDDLVNEGGIMDLWVREARLFKYGSGTGTNFSVLRGKNEALSGGGKSSGLMSWLKIGDRAAGAIKSGGTTRRAAKMVVLDADHPDIEEFTNWKVNEEKKVAILIAAGYPSDYEGEAYQTVSGQNSNNSVRIPHRFMEAVKNDGSWNLTWRTDGSVAKTIKARSLWDQISNAAWSCADPGVQYDGTINEWHTCPQSGRINASNPCSEYMFIDDTACNLASINLLKFYDIEKRYFQVAEFKHAARILTLVLETSVLMAQFPSKEIAQGSYDFRTLGLGYANLGSVLMMAGVPYESEDAYAFAACVTSIMTAKAYKTSAEMAKILGPFPKFEYNRDEMLRVIRNHRRAAFNAEKDEYEKLTITPKGIDPQYAPAYMLAAARESWNDALMMGERYGYRNAQVTCLAPTGTIGLLMDCSTTGVEPDFALVKFKKLAGGGYFRIANEAMPLALKNLGYADKQIEEILNYVRGTAKIDSAPHINKKTLQSKGLNDQDIESVNKALTGAFDVKFVFNVWMLGEDCLKRAGFISAQYNDPNFNMLRAFGFTDEEIEAANEFVCGTMTIEGAPHLKLEHYMVFDTANRNGKKGKRFIPYMGHIKMMAATQPFLSGAISKTINMSNEATVDDVKYAYDQSWQMGLKSVALYRDGCKLSQPLSTSSKNNDKRSDLTKEESVKEKIVAPQALIKEEEIKEIVKMVPSDDLDEALQQASEILSQHVSLSGIQTPTMSYHRDGQVAERRVYLHGEKRRLPAKRGGITISATIGGKSQIWLRTGEYPDGKLAEIFIDMYKEGSAFSSMLNMFAINVSMGLQYGVPLEKYVENFTFTRFEPSGMTDHPNIKMCTSVIDFVFRVLGMEYLGRMDFVQVPTQGIQKNKFENLAKLARAGVLQETIDFDQPQSSFAAADSAVGETQATLPNIGTPKDSMSQSLGKMMGDAPACPTCGHITVRNGSCYKCLNCGDSLGCS